jgi:hypothetical protein
MIVTLLLCMVTIPVLSQQTTILITAREAYRVAVDSGASRELANPRLVGVTAPDIKNAPLLGAVKYDITTGRANLWLFAFRSELNNEARVYGVFKSVLDGKTYAAPIADTANTSRFYMSDNWKNSDSVPKYFLRNNLMQLYRTQYPDSSAATLVCANEQALNLDDSQNPFPVDASIWVGIFNIPKTGIMVCAFDAVSGGETYCSSIPTSVEDETTPVLTTLFPNPASEFIVVRLPESMREGSAVVAIYDIHGTEVATIGNPNRYDGNSTMIIPVRQLTQGTYGLRVVSGKKTAVSTFVVQR